MADNNKVYIITKAKEEPQGKPYEDDPDAEEAVQNLSEAISKVGIPFSEASDAAGRLIAALQDKIAKDLKAEEEIRLIRMNPGLHWWEKRRLIREIRKEARDG